MSNKIMNACAMLQGMSGLQKAVLMALADHADDNGVCWPGLDHLALRTCFHRRSISEALAWLADAGLLTRKYSPHTSVIYRVTPATYKAIPQRPTRPSKTSKARRADEQRAASELTETHERRSTPVPEAPQERRSTPVPEAPEERRSTPAQRATCSAHQSSGAHESVERDASGDERRSCLEMSAAHPNPQVTQIGTTKESFPAPLLEAPAAIQTTASAIQVLPASPALSAKPDRRASRAESETHTDGDFQNVYVRTLRSFLGAYRLRYGREYANKEQLEAQVMVLFDRIGADAPEVAHFYVNKSDVEEMEAGHPFEILLERCHRYYGLWWDALDDETDGDIV